MAYASTDDLTAYIAPDAVPANAEWLLEAASDEVDAALIGAVYVVDTDGLPTEAATILALKKATLAQAHYRIGVSDPTGALSRFSSFSIGSISGTLANGGSGSASTGASALAPAALSILRVAGLRPANITGTNWGWW